ncbi:MAG: PD-(D/E)XK nuclease family protein [Limnothrix sp.]
MIRLSQAHLQTFAQCPPSFQQKYLAKLASPNDPQQLAKQRWGVQFHQIMQQLQLGFTLETLVTEDELKVSVEALLAQIPDFLQTPNDHFSEAEHRRSLQVGDFALTVIYDWLVQRGDRLTICDWKTYPKPEKANDLSNHWQTKLYLYVLAETTDYAPEQLSMTYWFVKLPNQPESITINYSAEAHQQIKRELTKLLQQLQAEMDDYFRANIPLQHPDQKSCWRCPPQLHDRRSPQTFSDQTIEAFLADIDPIPL